MKSVSIMPDEILKTTAETEIVSTRIFNYPKALLYQAWTDPKHLINWWGPTGFTNTFHEHDLRIGGRWKFTMHGPEAGHYENEAEFIKIDPPHCIAWKRHSKPIFQVLTSFEDLGAAQTKVVFKMLFHSPEERNKLIAFVPEKNEENFDRLEAELERMG